MRGFPHSSVGKESACNAGDLGLIPGLGRSPGEGKGYPFSILAWRIPLYSPWGHKESDTTEHLSLHFIQGLVYILAHMFCPLRGPESKETPAAKITPSIKILVSNACACSVVSDSLQPHELCSPPDPSVHRIFQARILEWAAIFSCRGSSKPGFPASPALAGRFFTTELHRKPSVFQ